MDSHVDPISRRKFLTVVGGAGVAAAAYAGPSHAAVLRASAAASTKQSVLKIVSGESDGPSGTTDPAFSTSDADGTRISLVYDRLMYLDNSWRPQPQLATSWSSNKEGTVWEFKLRRGVKFHDGTPLTAADVVYSFQRLLDPKTGSAATSEMTGITSNDVSAPDPYTVRFDLKAADVVLPLTITNRFTFIVKNGMTKEFLRKQAIGTGPFKLASFTPGVEPTTFTKNSSYWMPGKPYVQGVSLTSITEEASRIAALESGEVHIIWDMTSADATSLGAQSGVDVYSVKTPFIVNLACWCDTPPFTDNRVRQAMKLVLDRSQVQELTVGKFGAVAYDDPVGGWMEYGLDVKGHVRDVKKAKQLLEAAGHHSGLSLELYTSDATDGMVQLATIFKQNAAPAGIDVNIIQADADSYWSDIWLKKPFVASSWSAQPAPNALATPYQSSSQWNETHWREPQFDALLKKAQSTTNVAEQTKCFHEAQQMIVDTGGALIPVYVDTVVATRKTVTGFPAPIQKFYKDFREVRFT
jgi:peptide/nickel transport system substrate-binding protein